MKNEEKSKDGLGDRMKGYENITRYHLMPRGYVLCRIDGKSFHSYLKGYQRPFDKGVMDDMDATAVFLCENVQNAKLGFVQSDEITLLLCDFDQINTSQFFNGNIQKISSVVASMATAKFNQLRVQRQFVEKNQWYDPTLAMFDCRCWNVPNAVEAMNVLRWRQQDCIRNSVSMVAQANFSHKQLHGKSQSDMHEMLHQKGINWATDFTDGEKNGRIILKETRVSNFNLESIDMLSDGSMGMRGNGVTRPRWVSKGAWVFTKDEGQLLERIPQYES
jgi:tRNA(His) 5'-end guanylyltransferase